MLTLDKIYHAAYVLKPVARKTDVIYAAKLSQGYDLYLKTENLQLTGSFKLRGAYYKISQLNEEQRKAGIIACSAGNHAQGVALAASRMGIKAIVCMPDGAPISKVEATKALGAEVCLVKGAYDDAYNYACQLQQETGMTFIHPFNDEEVIAGQGTIGLEILDQLPDVDAVVCSIGGGGLISGVACAIKLLNPKVKVYGVQAENAPSMKRSLEAGEAITLDSVRTFADGIAVKHPGDITLDMVRKYVDEVVTVSEDEIAKNLEKDYSIIYQGMQIEYPSTIYLYVEERKPVAVMRWLGSQYELDAHGMVMSESDSMTLPEGMPLVTGFRVTAVHVGQTLSLRSQKQMDIYCQLLSELSLQEYADEVTEINLSDTENLYLITQEGISVRMGDGEYLRAKVGAIRTYIAYFRQLGTDSGVLDVSIPEDGKFMPER